MKNFFKIVVLTAIFCLVTSCENSIGKKNLEENDADQTDSEISDEDADSGDTTDADEPDTTTDEDGEIPDETEDDTTDTTDEDNNDIVDTDPDEDESAYHSPYGSVSFSFENIIGTQEDPGTSGEVFATGTYGNASAEIKPVYADKVQTDAFVYNDYIQIQQTPIYVDGTLGNPVAFFYLPLETAYNPGIYNLGLNSDAAIILTDVDWTSGQIQCYHAFGEGTLEISESNINDSFKVINLSGNATLYHPLNYKGEDVSQTFVQTFTGTNVLCSPVD